MKDPNKWKWAYCPKSIRELFDKYLSLTKWKSYVWFKKLMKYEDYKKYYKELIRLFGVYGGLKIFWCKITYTLCEKLKRFFMFLYK